MLIGGRDLGTSCIECGADINNMNDFYALSCKCGYTMDHLCTSCFERGSSADFRVCTRCGEETTSAQRYQTR